MQEQRREALCRQALTHTIPAAVSVVFMLSVMGGQVLLPCQPGLVDAPPECGRDKAYLPVDS